MKRLLLSIALLVTVIGAIQLATHFAAKNSDETIAAESDTTAIDSIMENITPPTPQE